MNYNKIKIRLAVGAAILGLGLQAAPVRTMAANNDSLITMTSSMYTPGGKYLGNSGSVTRAQFAKMLVDMGGYEGNVKKLKKNRIFKDVKKNKAYTGYINAAALNGYIQGYSDGTFKPDKKVTMDMAIYAAMAKLGFTTADFSAPGTPSIKESFYSANLGKGINKRGKEVLSGSDCQQLIANLLTARTKDGNVLANKLGIDLNADGSINTDKFIRKNMKIFIADKYTKTRMNAQGLKVIRDNKPASIKDVNEYDLVYYSKKNKVLRAYSGKVYGQISEFIPGSQNPLQVKIGDRVYDLRDEPVNKVNNADSLGNAWAQTLAAGNLDKGSYVVGILDRDGKIAAIKPVKEIGDKIIGYVLDNGWTKTKTNNNSFSIGNSIKIVNTAGIVMEVPAPSSTVGVGNVVEVRFGNDSTPVVEAITEGSRLTKDDISKISKNVRAIEVSGGVYTTIGYGALKEAQFDKLQVAYAGYDNSGNITDLILRGGLGQVYKYGMITDIDFGGFTYDVKGNTLMGSLNDRDGNTAPGARAFTYDKDGKLLDARAMKEVTVNMIKDGQAYTNNGTYLFPDDVSVYYKAGTEYKYGNSEGLGNLTGHVVKGYSLEGSNVIRVLVIER